MKKLIGLALACVALVFSAQQSLAQGFQLPNMQVKSNAFADGGIIPIKFTSHGDNVQPDFTITGAPDTTVSYAIIMHDIEVALQGSTNDVTHWVAFNIPSPNIAEGSLPAGSVNGNNIRNQPGLNNTQVIGRGNERQATIVGGFRCLDNLVWWEIEVAGQRGWTAERAQNGEQLILPR